MTLHLSAIMQGHAVQVSDRLATTTAEGQTRRFNPAMNKNVIYQAIDGLVSIGVSGLGLDAVVCVLPRDVDDLDAFVPKELLDVCEELLGLLR